MRASSVQFGPMREVWRSSYLFGCHLDRRDVDALIDRARAGLERPHVVFKIGDGQTQFEGDQFDDLVSEVGTPARLKHLEIHVLDDDPLQKGVHVHIDDFVTHLGVAGVDATWVHGRYSEMETLLKRTQRNLTFLRILAWIACLSAPGLAGAGTFLWVITGTAWAWVAWAAGIATAGAGLVLLRIVRRERRSWVAVREEADRPRDRLAVAGFVVALVGAAAAIMQVIWLLASGSDGG